VQERWEEANLLSTFSLLVPMAPSYCEQDSNRIS
jgi:hypothetical protein